MKSVKSVALAFLFCVLSSPAFAGKMKEVDSAILANPDKATIVFVRPGSFVGAAIAVPVFEVGESEIVFAGLVDAGSKFAHVVAPGEHRFATTVVGGQDGVRLYKANVEAGKIYFFRARIIDGIWGLEPIHSGALSSAEFKKWNEGTDNTVNSEKTIAWGKDNLANVTERIRQAEASATFSDKNSLSLSDGL